MRNMHRGFILASIASSPYRPEVNEMKASSGKDHPPGSRRRMTALKLMISLLVALLLLPLAAQGAQAAPDDIMLASSNAGGLEGGATSDYPAISADGRYVVFRSDATNLVPGVTGVQIYRKDLLTNEVRLVSENAGRVQGDNSSADARISADGLSIHRIWLHLKKLQLTQLRRF